jgi:AraC-like DNA-binding protein
MLKEPMSFAQYLIRTDASAPGHTSDGTFSCGRPRLLADVVDAIWDWDVPGELAAKSLVIKQAPGTSLLLMNQYRSANTARHLEKVFPAKWGTQLQQGTLYLQPSGPLGVIVVCLKPEGARRIVGAPLREFGNGPIDLQNVFPASTLATCEELLASARTSAERIALVEAGLLRRLTPPIHLTAHRAASMLRRDPTIPPQQLASELDVSPRQLSRVFTETFGLGLSRFARLTRIENIVALRNAGLSWAQIAYAANMSDQAHLVREFKSIVGETPVHFFGRESDSDVGMLNGANFVIQRR